MIQGRKINIEQSPLLGFSMRMSYQKFQSVYPFKVPNNTFATSNDSALSTLIISTLIILLCKHCNLLTGGARNLPEFDLLSTHPLSRGIGNASTLESQRNSSEYQLSSLHGP